VALRVIAAYRTVSFDAATILSGIIPGEFLASKHRRIYDRYPAIINSGAELTARAKAAIRSEEKDRNGSLLNGLRC